MSPQKSLLMVASLAYSADWLGHEVRKLRGPCGGGVGMARGGGVKRSSRAGLPTGGNTTWVDHVVDELFQVSAASNADGRKVEVL